MKIYELTSTYTSSNIIQLDLYTGNFQAKKFLSTLPCIKIPFKILTIKYWKFWGRQ